MIPLVEFTAVDFGYGRSTFAIRGLSFTVAAGEIFGVIGPNAAGKTTLLRLLTRVVRPDRGEVRVDGESVDRLSPAAVARRVAVVQDLPRGFPYTVMELVLMGRFPHAPGRFFESDEDLSHAQRAMAMAGVLELAGRALDHLSAGERQRVMLARALCQGAPVLALDEPTAHLDLRFQAECVGLLRRVNREAGLTVVLITHDLNLAAEVSDRLLLLESGSAVRIGSPETVLEEATLEAAYGCRVVVDKHPSSRRPTVQVVWPDPSR